MPNAAKEGTTGRLAAVVVSLDDDGELLLVRRGSRSWSLPGDFLGADERIDEAAVRILKEQTGYKAHFGGLTDLSTDIPGSLSINVKARLAYPRAESRESPGGPVTEIGWHASMPSKVLDHHRSRVSRFFKERAARG